MCLLVIVNNYHWVMLVEVPFDLLKHTIVVIDWFVTVDITWYQTQLHYTAADDPEKYMHKKYVLETFFLTYKVLTYRK